MLSIKQFEYFKNFSLSSYANILVVPQEVRSARTSRANLWPNCYFENKNPVKKIYCLSISWRIKMTWPCKSPTSRDQQRLSHMWCLPFSIPALNSDWLTKHQPQLASGLRVAESRVSQSWVESAPLRSHTLPSTLLMPKVWTSDMSWRPAPAVLVRKVVPASHLKTWEFECFEVTRI